MLSKRISGLDRLKRITAGKLSLKEESSRHIVYTMPISEDSFIHFTKKERIPEILKAGKLLENPPYPVFGAAGVHAISTTYGMFQPGVQTTHAGQPDELGAILFKTSAKPKTGFIEEVHWESDVPLSSAKEISYSSAVSMLSHTPEQDKMKESEDTWQPRYVLYS